MHFTVKEGGFLEGGGGHAKRTPLEKVGKSMGG